ncbi:MAG: hypothetical protein ACR2NN_05020 [Bryobacteraceae bacterium]
MFADERRAPWQNPRILMTLLLVFMTGAVCGALTMRAGLHNFMHRTVLQLPGTQLSYEQLKKDLNLTPRQAEAIRMILDDSVKYHQDLQNQIEDVRATGKNRILAVLDSGQQQHFNRLCEQVQSR